MTGEGTHAVRHKKGPAYAADAVCPYGHQREHPKTLFHPWEVRIVERGARTDDTKETPER